MSDMIERVAKAAGIVKNLRRGAQECADLLVNGWGNTMTGAADYIETLDAWQPIETAPKQTLADFEIGEVAPHIMLYCPRPDMDMEGFQVVGYYHTPGKEWWGAPYEEIYQPTHWKPLSEPPKETL